MPPDGDITAVSAPPITPPAGGAPLGSPAATPVPPQWHQGVDNEIKTHWLNKGYDLSDPAKVAIAATKGQLEAVKYLGVPPSQLLRLPADVNDEAGWNAVYQRFGMPSDKSGYDFSKVKFSDGSDLDAGFAEFMRTKAHELKLPSTAATAISQAFIGFMEQADKTEAEQAQQSLVEEKAQLAKEWGNNYEFNKTVAMQGAQKLKISADAVAALEKVVGYSKVMEAMRMVGAGSVEPSYVEGQRGSGGFATPGESAKARLQELVNNPAWGQRLTSGDIEARREYDMLTRAIAKSEIEAQGGNWTDGA